MKSKPTGQVNSFAGRADKKHMPTYIRMFVLAALLTGCTLQSSQPDGIQPEETQSLSPPNTPTPEVTSETGAVPELLDVDPPPTGLIDVLYTGVDSGQWPYEQGLLAALQLVAGETKLDSVSTERPTSLEGTGVILEAQHYLRSGVDEQAKAEIERLLNVIAPSPESLREHSRPATASGHRSPGHAREVSAEQECAKLWSDGFPSGSGIQCFEYKTITVGNSKVELFYPISQMVPGFTLGYADAALEAVQDGLLAYANLTVAGKAALLQDIQIVFTLLESPEAGTLAVVPSAGGAKTCQVIVYPLSIIDNEGEKVLGAKGYEHFKQTIAHETFHCFQVWNFSEISGGLWAVHDWWGEGSAEYFGNFVYPAVNDEWEWLGTWRVNSSVKSLLDMSYENFGFFQYLANTLGNDAIMALLSSLPTANNLQAHEQALAKYPNMKFTFNAYARAFMDGEITDASGQMLETSPPYVRPEYQLPISQAEVLNLGAAPFVISRYILTFAPGHRYVLDKQPNGPDGFNHTRPQSFSGNWVDMPDQIIAGCHPAPYYALLTTTAAPPADVFNVQTTISVKDDVGCDKCLAGSWDLDLPSFEAYLSAPFEGTDPGFFDIDSMGGIWHLDFSPVSTVTATYDFFVLYALNQPGLLTDVLLDLEGEGSAQYLADGVSQINFIASEEDISLQQMVLVNGQEVQGGAELFGDTGPSLYVGLSGEAVYSCDEDTLILSFGPTGNLGEPLIFNRTSSSP